MKSAIIYSLSAIALLSSCKKQLEEKYQESTQINAGNTLVVSKMSDIKVPLGFKWETTRDVQVKISTSDVRFGNSIHKVSIYSADPNQGGIILAKGSVSTASPFEAKINTANTIQEYFLVKEAPDASKSMERIKISNNQVSLVLGYNNPVKLNKTSGPDCSSGCTTTISLSSGTYNATSGTVCITNSNIAGNLNISSGATVRVCGQGTINSVTINSGATLILSSSANITFNQKVTNRGTFTNYGTVVTSQDLEANSGTLTNNGTLTVGNDLKTVQTGTLINNGTLIVTNNHQTDKGSTTNNCYFWVKKSWEINGTSVSSPVFFNNGYLRVDDNSNINDLAAMTLTTGAMFKTKTIDLQNGKVIGTAGSGSATALLKVTNGGSIKTGARVSGLIQFCHPTSIPSGVLISGASAGCNLYIATTACNPDGNGSAPSSPSPDSDGDGVNDSNDEYPNDPNKAYNNLYGPSTVAFEDLWPAKGDYDLNDVVVNYNYNVITNAANNVVRVEAQYALRATGGSHLNGFGVQFPVNRSQISGVNGATLEAGQSKAVLVIFSNMREEMQMWNTVKGQNTSDVKHYTVSFNVSGGPSLATFGLGAYNPFIWNNTAGFGRGYEVHLPGQMPTDLANASLFGTGDDNTNVGNGNTYMSKNGGFPWAINIPASFDYPVEKADINTAYLKFATWVSSNGTQYANWYTNGSGYRNTNNIY